MIYSTNKITKKYIYFHICAINNYEEIIIEMMDQIQNSGTLNDIDELRYCVVGENFENAINIMNRYHNTNCIKKDPTDNSYERFTLHQMYTDALTMDDDTFLLYIHSKGVSKTSDELKAFIGISEWRRSMMIGLTSYRTLCWRELSRGIDCVGSYHVSDPCNHFSGNFWWTRSNYLNKLTIPIKDDYLGPEFWITSIDLKITTIADRYNNDISYSYHRIPPTDYYIYAIQFRSNLPLLNNIINISDIKFIEIGLDKSWTSIDISHLNESIALSNLNYNLDSEIKGMKILKIKLNSEEELYFLESEKITLIIN